VIATRRQRRDENTEARAMTKSESNVVRALGAGAMIAGVVCGGACQQDSAWREAYQKDKAPSTGSTPGEVAESGLSGNFDQDVEFFDPFAVSSTGGDAARPRRAQAQSLSAPTLERGFASQESFTHAMGDANVTQSSFSLAGADFDPDVSPDGMQIVFASTQHKHTSDIYIKSVSSRSVSQLTNTAAHEVMPKFSPDGKRVAFASNKTGDWDIYVMPTTGGNAVQITSTPANDLHPSWSPDGRSLVFCRLGEMSGKWEMWVTEVNNTGVQHFIGYGLFPEWCPAKGTGYSGADRILFQRSRERGDRAFGIWSIDYVDGHADRATEVAASPTAACINATWSPDGKWIVYATVPNANSWISSKPGAADLWLSSLQGHGRVNLTSSVTVDLMPSWGPNEKVYYVSDRGGLDNIWQIDVHSAIVAATGEDLDTDTAMTRVNDEQ
jgi:dipeptidyl aminopeptidase/acylaminoacyl peptidase